MANCKVLKVFPSSSSGIIKYSRTGRMRVTPKVSRLIDNKLYDFGFLYTQDGINYRFYACHCLYLGFSIIGHCMFTNNLPIHIACLFKDCPKEVYQIIDDYNYYKGL